MQDIRTVVASEFAAVNQLIIDQLHSDVALVENIGHYIVDAGGKRLRPLLVLLAAGASGSIDSHHITLATVIEFIHTATLLHDDVVDVSSLRRGRPTANAEWGNASSVLVGDFLYSRAFQLLVAIGDIPVMQLLSDTTNRIAEGEVLQLVRAGDPETDETSYLDIIERKTAVLFAAACAGAARLNQQPEPIIDALYRFGLHLGNAFQLADDLLDYTGDPELMGKQLGDDLAEGKPTLPLIYTLAHGDAAERAVITEAIRSRQRDLLADVVTAVTRSGALDYTRERAASEAAHALSCLTPLADSPCRRALQHLTELAIQRDS